MSPGPLNPSALRRLLVAAALLAVVALAFAAYVRPGMLLEFMNLRYCG